MFLATIFEAITHCKTKEQKKGKKGSRTGVGSKIIYDDFFPRRTRDRVPISNKSENISYLFGWKNEPAGIANARPFHEGFTAKRQKNEKRR
jgi:hypothetical protein